MSNNQAKTPDHERVIKKLLTVLGIPVDQMGYISSVHVEIVPQSFPKVTVTQFMYVSDDQLATSDVVFELHTPQEQLDDNDTSEGH